MWNSQEVWQFAESSSISAWTLWLLVQIIPAWRHQCVCPAYVNGFEGISAQLRLKCRKNCRARDDFVCCIVPWVQVHLRELLGCPGLIRIWQSQSLEVELNGEKYGRATVTNSDLVLEFQSGECSNENSASTVGCRPPLLLTLAREH